MALMPDPVCRDFVSFGDMVVFFSIRVEDDAGAAERSAERPVDSFLCLRERAITHPTNVILSLEPSHLAIALQNKFLQIIINKR